MVLLEKIDLPSEKKKRLMFLRARKREKPTHVKETNWEGVGFQRTQLGPRTLWQREDPSNNTPSLFSALA